MLEKKTANVLWDYGEEVTTSLSRLTSTLQKRFGGKAFADKHCIKIKNKRRGKKSLHSLNSDIRRLAALSIPDVLHKTGEKLATDYFVDAWWDRDLAMKIREQNPKDIDSALQLALQLEVWIKDTAQSEGKQTELKRTQKLTGTNKPSPLEKKTKHYKRR